MWVGSPSKHGAGARRLPVCVTANALTRHSCFWILGFHTVTKGELVESCSDISTRDGHGNEALSDTYRSLAAIDYLLGVAADAPVPASHLRQLLRPLLSDLDKATEM